MYLLRVSIFLEMNVLVVIIGVINVRSIRSMPDAVVIQICKDAERHTLSDADRTFANIKPVFRAVAELVADALMNENKNVSIAIISSIFEVWKPPTFAQYKIIIDYFYSKIFLAIKSRLLKMDNTEQLKNGLKDLYLAFCCEETRKLASHQFKSALKRIQRHQKNYLANQELAIIHDGQRMPFVSCPTLLDGHFLKLFLNFSLEYMNACDEKL